MQIGIFGMARLKSGCDKDALRRIILELRPSFIVPCGVTTGFDPFLMDIADEVGGDLVMYMPELSKMNSYLGMVTVYRERIRNIVDECDVIIALVSADRTGSTEKVIAYAQEHAKKVIIIPPKKEEQPVCCCEGMRHERMIPDTNKEDIYAGLTDGLHFFRDDRLYYTDMLTLLERLRDRQILVYGIECWTSTDAYFDCEIIEEQAHAEGENQYCWCIPVLDAMRENYLKQVLAREPENVPMFLVSYQRDDDDTDDLPESEGNRE